MQYSESDRGMGQQQGPVLTCQKEDCSYNQKDCCYADGIEVGDDHPLCDTYTHEDVRTNHSTSMVSACHVVDCVFNQDQDCHSPGITVGSHIGHADCLTARMQ